MDELITSEATNERGSTQEPVKTSEKACAQKNSFILTRTSSIFYTTSNNESSQSQRPKTSPVRPSATRMTPAEFDEVIGRRKVRETNRDPLNPTYKLASVKMAPVPEPKFIRDTLDVKDITGPPKVYTRPVTVPENGVRKNAIAGPAYSADRYPPVSPATANFKSWAFHMGDPSTSEPLPVMSQTNSEQAPKYRNTLDVRDIKGATSAIRSRERRVRVTKSEPGSDFTIQNQDGYSTFSRMGFRPKTTQQTGTNHIPSGSLSLITRDIPGAEPSTTKLGLSKRRTDPLNPDYSSCSGAENSMQFSTSDLNHAEYGNGRVSAILSEAKKAQNLYLQEVDYNNRTGYTVGPIVGANRETSKSGIGYLSYGSLSRSSKVRNLVREHEEHFRNEVKTKIEKEIKSGDLSSPKDSEWSFAELQDALVGDASYPEWSNRLVGPSSSLQLFRKIRNSPNPLRETNQLDDLPDSKAGSRPSFFTGSRSYHRNLKRAQTSHASLSGETTESGVAAHRSTDPLDPQYPDLGRPRVGLLARPRSPTQAESVSLSRAYLGSESDTEFNHRAKSWLEGLVVDERKRTIAFADENLLEKMLSRTSYGKGLPTPPQYTTFERKAKSNNIADKADGVSPASTFVGRKEETERFQSLAKSALWENAKKLKDVIAAEHEEEVDQRLAFENAVKSALGDLRKDTPSGLQQGKGWSQTQPLTTLVKKQRLTQAEYMLKMKAKQLAETKVQLKSTLKSESQVKHRDSSLLATKVSPTDSLTSSGGVPAPLPPVRDDWESTVRSSDIQLVAALQ